MQDLTLSKTSPVDTNRVLPSLFIFIFISACIFWIATVLWQYQAASIRKEREGLLLSISELKTDQIFQWRSERISDAHVFMHDPALLKAARLLLADRPDGKHLMTDWMAASMQSDFTYKSFYFINPEGKVLVSVPTDDVYVPSEVGRAVETVRSGKPQLTELHRLKNQSGAGMELISPVFDQHETGRDFLGAVVARIDPSDYLFPFLQSWPTVSNTAETLLVRRDGQEVLYLNQLRHKKESALTLRKPLDTQGLPASLAISGKTGIVEGTDYRGELVIAALRSVPDSGWFTVTKIDTAEMFVQLDRFFNFGVVVVILMISLLGLLLVLHQRSHAASIYRQMYMIEHEKLQLQDSLKATEARLQLHLENTPLAVIEWGPDYRLKRWSKEAERIFGWRAEEVLGKRTTEFRWIFEDDQDKVEAVSAGLLDGTNPRCVSINRNYRKDGTVVWCEWYNSSLSSSLGVLESIFSLVLDITEKKKNEEERRRMEDQIQQAHKLESIGTLAGGLAHDFNNLLTGLFGYFEMARNYARSGHTEEIPEVMERALKVFERVKGLIAQLLTFSKGGMPNKKTIVLSQHIKETAHFALSGSNCRLDFHFADGLWACAVDPVQFGQAISNIVINAKEAMPLGGTIFITAENCEVEKSITGSISPGKYIRITMEDEGPGLAPDVMKHIFDPFFTTKETGQGLGLSIAYSVIRKHGGMIDAENSPRGGAIFEIYLPASLELPKEEESVHLPSGQRSEGRILVMDDEPSILEVASHMLSSLGYKPECAANGEEALNIYKDAIATGRPFDAVILDLTIRGGMGGEKTLQELRKLDDKVNAIVSSGYSNDPIMADFEAYGFRGVAAKPYTTKMIRDVLRRALGGEVER